MRRRLARFAENIDALMPLVLGLVVSVLSALDIVSAHLVENSVLISISVFSFVLLRNRWNTDSGDEEMRQSAARTERFLTELGPKLDLVGQLEQSTASLRTAVDGLSAITTLRGIDIDRAFAEARQHTDRWVFKGGTGSYTRAVTLPQCAETARRERRPLTVRLQILDPTNTRVCEQYAHYRSSLSLGPDGTGEPWTAARTHKESFATVLAACWYRQRFQTLDIVVGLTAVMSTFRYDMSSSRIIITQDDSQFPAMVITSDSPLYDSYATELQASLSQTSIVPLESAAATVLSARPTVSEAREIFARLNLKLPDDYTDQDVDEIIERTVHARNPYADLP